MSKFISPSAKLLFHEARARNLKPEWMIPELVFRGFADGREFYCHDTKTNLNSQLGARFCENKVVTRNFLEKSGYLNIPYIYTLRHEEVNRFFDKHKPIVSKPILGKRAEGIRLIDDRVLLRDTPLKHNFFEKYIQGIEYRYLLINQQLVLVQKRMVVPTPNAPWHKKITNLYQGEYEESLVHLSVKLAKSLKMGFLAVDWIVSEIYETYVLELNAAPGIYSSLNPDSGPKVDVPKLLLDAIINHNNL